MSAILKWTSVAFGLLALLFFISVNRNLAGLAELFMPGSALWTHLALLSVEALALGWLWLGIARRRRALVFSPDLDPRERQRLHRELARRLRENPLLKNAAANYADLVANSKPGSKAAGDFNDPDFQQYCHLVLRHHADQETRRTAERIFLATALAQNGRIDALIVFVSLCRLIWRISSIYNQKPHPAELLALYWAVASSVFLALSFEELDIATEISMSFGEAFHAIAPASLSASLPFVGAALQRFTAASIDGAANSYLALRTGIIARNAYAFATEESPRPTRSDVYKEAGAVLLEMSSQLVEQMTKRLGSALWGMTRAAGEKTVNTSRNVASELLRAGADMADNAGRFASGAAQSVSATGENVSRAGKNAAFALSGAGNDLSQGLTMFVSKVRKNMSTAAESAGRSVEKTASDLHSSMHNAATSLENSLTRLASKTEQSVNRATDSVKTSLSDLASGTERAAGRLHSGLKRGLFAPFGHSKTRKKP